MDLYDLSSRPAEPDKKSAWPLLALRGLLDWGTFSCGSTLIAKPNARAYAGEERGKP